MEKTYILKKFQNNFYLNLSKFINKGDNIYVESDFSKFNKIYKKTKSRNIFCNFFFQVFKKLVGKNGNIIVPSFSYSWGRDNKKKVFDLTTTQSKTGLFSEYIRRKRNVCRTNDPMFSFLIYGKNKKYLKKIKNDSFGQNSLFSKINNDKTKLISFGLEKFDPTFVHFVEQYFDKEIKKIKYRKIYKFKGLIKIKKKYQKKIFYCLMRPPSSKLIYDDANIKKKLLEEKKLKILKLHNNNIYICSAKNFFDAGLNGMLKNINFFNKKI
jgi:aminoglycoside 3-N-acetyltransferase